MKLRAVLSACILLLPALITGMSARAQETAAEWAVTTINEREYYSLEQLRSFYKLRPIDTASSHLHTIGNSSFRLAFNTQSMELIVAGYRCRLSHPIIKSNNGELLISKTDFVKLIDPILRPTYIAERREVRTVVIDPGHGGSDPGNKSEWLCEADCTLNIALALARELEKRGLHVILTRNTDQDLADAERVRTAREAPAAIFISLHVNSGRSDIRGIETYTAAPLEPNSRALEAHRHDAANIALAFALHSHVLNSTHAADGACRRSHYSLLNTVNCPAALVQVGYATHKQEASALAGNDYRAELVTGLADGIAAFCSAISVKAELKPSRPEEEAVTLPAPKPKPAVPTPKKDDKSIKNKKQNKRKPAPTKPRRRRR